MASHGQPAWRARQALLVTEAASQQPAHQENTAPEAARAVSIVGWTTASPVRVQMSARCAPVGRTLSAARPAPTIRVRSVPQGPSAQVGVCTRRARPASIAARGARIAHRAVGTSSLAGQGPAYVPCARVAAIPREGPPTRGILARCVLAGGLAPAAAPRPRARQEPSRLGVPRNAQTVVRTTATPRTRRAPVLRAVRAFPHPVVTRRLARLARRAARVTRAMARVL